jgi:hypothetical protein
MKAGAADTAIAATTRYKSLQMIERYGEAFLGVAVFRRHP